MIGLFRIFMLQNFKDMAKIERKTLLQKDVIAIFEYKHGLLYRRKINPRTNKQICLSKPHKTRDGIRHRTFFQGKTHYSARLIFLYHFGWLPDCVDHENHITSDDRIENLRAATISENTRNRSSAKGSTSKYLGVYLHVYKNRKPIWTSIIRIGKKMKRLGSFKTEELAALSYNKAAVKLWGEFANLNIIQL